MAKDTTLLFEVYRNASGIVTVTTEHGGLGTRLCGIKLPGSGSTKVAEFRLDRAAIDSIVEDFESAEQGGVA
jgi:hypothetical protein